MIVWEATDDNTGADIIALYSPERLIYTVVVVNGSHVKSKQVPVTLIPKGQVSDSDVAEFKMIGLELLDQCK